LNIVISSLETGLGGLRQAHGAGEPAYTLVTFYTGFNVICYLISLTRPVHINRERLLSQERQP
jgi:hypothetical protein